MRSNVVWVFQTFGVMAGLKYIWHSLVIKVNRSVGREPIPVKFEDLTDEQAQQVALAFNLQGWNDRDGLNQVWHKFEGTLN